MRFQQEEGVGTFSEQCECQDWRALTVTVLRLLWLSLWLCDLQQLSPCNLYLDQDQLGYDTLAPDPVIAWPVTMLRQGPLMYPYSYPSCPQYGDVLYIVLVRCIIVYVCTFQTATKCDPAALDSDWKLSWAALAPGIVSYFYITSFKYIDINIGPESFVMISIISWWHCHCVRFSILYMAVLLHWSLNHAIQLKAKCPPKWKCKSMTTRK